jgi:hypothetical protein
LTDSQKQNAKNLEARLRDEIRGRNLISPEIVEAVSNARARGVEVLLFDEGGTDNLSETERADILTRVVEELLTVTSGKVIVRAPKGESWKVTFVASQRGKNTPDIWLKF